MLNLGLFIQRSSSTINNIVNTLIENLQDRVSDSSGDFEASSCLSSFLENLKNIE